MGNENKEKIGIPFPFTDKELLELASQMNPSSLWQRAFYFYNSDHRNSRLSIGCRSCFNKVLVYLLSKRFQQ